MQLAAGLLDGTGEGMWLVEVTPVADPDLVARTVAALLWVREEPERPLLDTLVEAVGDRYLMVVLDNAEHVLGAVANLADSMLWSCLRGCLLVTSGEPLGVSGERVFRVSPLTAPLTDLAAAPGRLADLGLVRLFAKRRDVPAGLRPRRRPTRRRRSAYGWTGSRSPLSSPRPGARARSVAKVTALPQMQLGIKGRTRRCRHCRSCQFPPTPEVLIAHVGRYWSSSAICC